MPSNPFSFLPDEPDKVLTGDEEFDETQFRDDEDILYHESDSLGIDYFEAMNEEIPDYEEDYEYGYYDEEESLVNTW